MTCKTNKGGWRRRGKMPALPPALPALPARPPACHHEKKRGRNGHDCACLLPAGTYFTLPARPPCSLYLGGGPAALPHTCLSYRLPCLPACPPNTTSFTYLLHATIPLPASCIVRGRRREGACCPGGGHCTAYLPPPSTSC